MIRSIVTALLLAFAAVISTTVAAGEKPAATLYKNPQCGCCEGYAEYLRANGYSVDVKPTHELTPMSRAAVIPDDFQGCHLTYIDNYVVSGHVPVETVNRLLSERPAIKGITLPGMPMGSPGMNGVKQGPFTIYTIGSDQPTVYATE